jgi:fibronectin type 3 domain-containing protein
MPSTDMEQIPLGLLRLAPGDSCVNPKASTRDVSETSVILMKTLFNLCMIFCCLSSGLAQGIQGEVTLGGKTTVVVTGHSVVLGWNASQGAASYNTYRGTVSGGPYLKVSAGNVSTTFSDAQVTHAQTFYYVTTAVSGSLESGYSNEVSAVIP